tara:strand:+ start:15115 stop:15345 length:231 start_codon:yes stop_codon:yes gene_type:complete
MIRIKYIVAYPFILIIRLYQTFISPILGKNCIYDPSCSNYGIQALTKYGLIKGGFLTIKRILKCNSLFKGGYDPLK